MDREAAAKALADIRRKFPKLTTEELGGWLPVLEQMHDHDVAVALERILLESAFPPTLALIREHALRASRDRTEHERADERRREAAHDRASTTERQAIAYANLRRLARLLAEPTGSDVHRAIIAECERNVDARTSHYGREFEEGERERLAAPLGLGDASKRDAGRRLVRLGD